MQFAIDKKLQVDVFQVYTDNETYAGRHGHPCQILEKYRQQSGRNAKLVVFGIDSNDFSIADPKDPSSMDVVGFDTSVPAIVRDFIIN